MKTKERLAAIELRKRGHSLNEIVKVLDVSKSSASLWVSDVVLSKKAEKILLSKSTAGQLASQKAIKAKTVIKDQLASNAANLVLSNLILSKEYAKLLCAMIYYCEGRKSVREGMSFTNSDPGLISIFLRLFRGAFELYEEKFRVCVHLHSYHDPKKQLKFWSKTTNIPLRQFIKPYLKPSSGMYKKEGYPGCINVRYGDVRISRELRAIALRFMKNMGL